MQSMAKLTDTQKDEANDSFVNLVMTKSICKEPWGQLVRYIHSKLTQCLCMCYSKINSSLDYRTNKRGTRSAMGDTDSFVSARVGDLPQTLWFWC